MIIQFVDDFINGKPFFTYNIFKRPPGRFTTDKTYNAFVLKERHSFRMQLKQPFQGHVFGDLHEDMVLKKLGFAKIQSHVILIID